MKLSLISFCIFFVGCSVQKVAEVKEEKKDIKCSLKSDPGPCRAAMERFYYDKTSKSCVSFMWGGCEGSAPFETKENCEKLCL